MPGDSAARLGPVPRVTGQLESSLYVANLHRSRGFYKAVFGFETLLQEGRMVGLAVPGGTIPPHDGQGTLHLCFAVPLAELDAWERHLATLGIAIESRVMQGFGSRSPYFRDPDGPSLEIAVPGLWAAY